VELTCNGAGVLAATITIPRVGRWQAELTLEADAGESGAATIANATGTLSMRGTIVRGGEHYERGRVRVVGGGGGLSGEVSPKFYRGVPARIPLADLLTEAGETLAASSSASALDTTLPLWARSAGPASSALAHMLDALGAGWRTLLDGSVWVGVETWPEVPDFAHDVLDDDPSDGAVSIACDELPAGLLPGTTFMGRRVSSVEHRVSGSRIRTAVLFEEEGAADRATGPFDSLVRLAARQADYHALYPAAVVYQNPADGTLHVQPESPALPSMTDVPLRLGLPGVKVTVTNAARVLIGFEGGDPRAPVAMLWNPDGMTELRLGVNASAFVALANLVDARIGALVAWANTHTHGGAVAAPTLAAQASVAASKVKAE
jgi:hypothetical protein